jgi:hypothetical protein
LWTYFANNKERILVNTINMILSRERDVKLQWLHRTIKKGGVTRPKSVLLFLFYPEMKKLSLFGINSLTFAGNEGAVNLLPFIRIVGIH